MKKIFLLTLTLLTSCQGEIKPMSQLPTHHTEQGFKNLHTEDQHKSFFKFMKMRMTEPWADHSDQANRIPQVKPNLTEILQPNPQKLHVTWIGHSTFLLQYQGINILTDPVFSERASPSSIAGPKRYTQAALTIAQLPRIDIVVISHNHYDHMDQSSIKQLNQYFPKIQWVIPLKNQEPLIEEGVKQEQIKELDWWDKTKIQQVTLTCTPAQHWSARGLFDKFKALWSSWVIEIDDQRIFFAGDTGYNPHTFKEIGERYPDFDLALIPIGAYAPRWFMQTMHIEPEEAVKIHKEIKSKKSIAMHWGTFPLTAEDVDEPPQKLKKAKEAMGLTDLEFVTFAIGQNEYF